MSHLSPSHTRRLPKRQGFKQGFTLIELLMAITVITILASITFGISRGVQNAQFRAKTKAELAHISQALEQFKSRQGDYPWTEETADQAVANSEQLLKALLGWMEFERDSGVTAFDDIAPEDQPSGGPAVFLDISKLTIRAVGNEEPFVDLPEDRTTAPDGYYLADPWGEPYVYVYGQADAATNTWDVFGYHLYSKGSDQSHDLSAMNASTGVLVDGYREAGSGQNLDNIYSGE